MNLGIQHSARPGDFSSKSSSKVPREVAAMARQLGLDLSTMGGEADNLWAMLNDMSETDPAAYDKFIAEQLEEKEGDGGGDSKPLGRTFTPTPSFVVKVRFRSGGLSVRLPSGVNLSSGCKLFVNVCEHRGVQRPLGSDGQPVADGRPHLDNCQIPLLVSPIRSCEDAEGGEAAAVDVVLNPWSVGKANENNVFRAQIVELCLQWVQKECHVSVEKQWKVINAKYKGGTGKTGSDAVPFPVDESMLDKKEVEEERRKRAAEKEKLAKLKRDLMMGPMGPGGAAAPAAGGGGDAGVGGVGAPTISSPESLLETMKSAREGEGGGGGGGGKGIDLLNLGLGGDGKAGGDKKVKKPLIEEVGATKKSTKPSIDEVSKPPTPPSSKSSQSSSSTSASFSSSSSSSSKDAPKAKPATVQMKGFLNTPKAKEAAPLYEAPSSGDGMGGTGGSYSRFMSKCKVVDTSAMPPDQQRKAMEQHAAGSGGGGSNAAAATSASSSSKAAAPAGTFDGMKKNAGFLNGKAPLYEGKGSKEGAADEGSFDAEFQKLMEAADPQFASQFEDPNKKDSDKSSMFGGRNDDALTEALAGLAGVIGSSPNEEIIGPEINKLKKRNDEKRAKETAELRALKERQASALELECSSAAKAANPTVNANSRLGHSVSDTADGDICVTIDLSLAPSEKLSMSDLDLEVALNGLRLSSSYGKADIKFGVNVDCENVKAKLSQKQKQLKVTLKKL